MDGEVTSIRDFFERQLRFKRGSSKEVIGSKVYEKEERTWKERVYIEVYNAEGYYTLIFGLNTRDPDKVKYLAELLNSVLEEFAALYGFKRAM
jgi:hypothetical protein